MAKKAQPVNKLFGIRNVRTGGLVLDAVHPIKRFWVSEIACDRAVARCNATRHDGPYIKVTYRVVEEK